MQNWGMGLIQEQQNAGIRMSFCREIVRKDFILEPWLFFLTYDLTSSFKV